MRTAILIPCYNEEQTIGKVVKDCRKYLPDIRVYVGDNGSTDNTSNIAKSCGATVIVEASKGKGRMLAKMFNVIDADAYVIIDGDDTYNLEDVPHMLQLFKIYNGQIVATRFSRNKEAFPPFHKAGNYLLSKLVSVLYGYPLQDMLSGFRCIPKVMAQKYRRDGNDFEVETELSLQAIEDNIPIIEFPSFYKERPFGSFSKLHTFRDGYKIIKYILKHFIKKKIIPHLPRSNKESYNK